MHEWAQDWAAAFNAANPDILVEIFTDVPDVRDALVVEYAAGVAPDIVHEVDSVMGHWVRNGFASPLDTYFDAWEDRSDWIPAMLEGATFGGRLYALPYRLQPWYDFVNLEVLGEVGYSTANYPDTWESMINMVRSITRIGEGGAIQRYGWFMRLSGWRVLPDLNTSHIQMTGQPIIEEGATQANLNTPEVAEALTYLQNLVAAGMPGDYNGRPSNAGLIDGRIAIFHNFSTGDLGGFVRGLGDRDLGDFALMRYPGPAPGQSALQYQTGSIFMVSSTPNPDATWRVMQDFVSAATMKSYLMTRGGNLSVRQSQILDPDLLGEAYALEQSQLIHPPFTPYGVHHTDYFAFRDAGGPALVQAIANQFPMTEGLMRSTHEINNVIGR